MAEQITFKIPLLPESVNGLYKINFTHHCVYLSDEGRAFKYQAKLFIPKMTFGEGSFIGVEVEYHCDWYYKNGKVRRADSMNLDKLMCDTLAEHLGIDDSYFWEWSSKKVQDKDRYTLVRVKEVGSCPMQTVHGELKQE